MSSLTTAILPMGVEPAIVDLPCWEPGCRAKGPYRSVPTLAQHRWSAHGIDLADTYEACDYRDQDDSAVIGKERGMARGICRRCAVFHGRTPCPKRDEPVSASPAVAATPTPKARRVQAAKKARRVTKRKPAGDPLPPTVTGLWPTTVRVRGLEVLVNSWAEFDALAERYGS